MIYSLSGGIGFCEHSSEQSREWKWDYSGLRSDSSKAERDEAQLDFSSWRTWPVGMLVGPVERNIDSAVGDWWTCVTGTWQREEIWALVEGYAFGRKEVSRYCLWQEEEVVHWQLPLSGGSRKKPNFEAWGEESVKKLHTPVGWGGGVANEADRSPAKNSEDPT